MEEIEISRLPENADRRALATLLVKAMSDVSRGAYGQAWTPNHEHLLYDAVLHGNMTYGNAPLSIEVQAELQALARAAKGWGAWDYKDGFTFVPQDEWDLNHAAWRRSYGHTHAHLRGESKGLRRGY